MQGQCLGTAHHVPGGARPHRSQFRRHRAFPCALLALGRLEIDVIGAQGGEPLVNHLEHLGGPAHHVLGDEDDLLANLGRWSNHFLKSGSER